MLYQTPIRVTIKSRVKKKLPRNFQNSREIFKAPAGIYACHWLEFTHVTENCVKIIRYFLTKPHDNKSNGSNVSYKSALNSLNQLELLGRLPSSDLVEKSLSQQSIKTIIGV